MNCPKCFGKLSPVKVGSVEIDRCVACEGLWFDSGELECVLEEYSKGLQEISLDSKIFDGKEAAEHYEHYNSRHGDCPRCEAKMFRIRFDDVQAETCPNDHGIWLDGVEIASLKSVKQKSFSDLFKYIFSLNSFKDFVKSFKRDSKI